MIKLEADIQDKEIVMNRSNSLRLQYNETTGLNETVRYLKGSERIEFQQIRGKAYDMRCYNFLTEGNVQLKRFTFRSTPSKISLTKLVFCLTFIW